jgi:hypothetical protein
MTHSQGKYPSMGSSCCCIHPFRLMRRIRPEPQWLQILLLNLVNLPRFEDDVFSLVLFRV